MEKVLRHVTQSGIVVVILFLSICPAFAIETNAWIPTIEILTPGMGRTITITQDYNFPQGSSQFLVFLIGYGIFNIYWSSEYDTEGDILILTGAGISSAGIVPFFKRGKAGGYFEVGIEIGSERAPYGVVWFSSWIHSSVNDPPYSYSLDLSF